MLHAFYHVWEQNHWREVLLEHFRILQRQHFQGPLTIGFIGQPHTDGFIRHMLDAHELDGSVHCFGPDASQFEFPTLQLLQAAAQAAPQHQYLYFHTKGVSRPNDWMTCNWRWYLNAFVLGQLVNLVPELAAHDLVGAGWGNHCDIGPHFPGNFWLGRGDYLAALPEFSAHVAAAEDWLERPEVKQHSFLSLRHAAETWVAQSAEAPRIYDCGHESAEIWHHAFWVNHPELQKFVALHGTQ
jgi:hypothetical protein